MDKVELKNCDTCKNFTHPGRSDGRCVKADGVECKGDRTWRSWESREDIKEYEIVKPFSIIDIYEKKPCSGEFSTLLKNHGAMHIDAKWNEFRFIKKSKVLMRNLDWLEKNGFVVEKKEESDWFNVYINNSGDGVVPFGGYSSKEQALKQTKTNNPEYIGTVQLKPKT